MTRRTPTPARTLAGLVLGAGLGLSLLGGALGPGQDATAEARAERPAELELRRLAHGETRLVANDRLGLLCLYCLERVEVCDAACAEARVRLAQHGASVAFTAFAAGN